MSAVLRKMRKALDEYLDTGMGPTPSTRTLFANHPGETDELLRQLFEAYDAGDKTDLEIEGLLRVKVAVHIVHTKKSVEARKRKHALNAAYSFPPTCERALWLSLRGVVHSEDEPAFCESLVRDYPNAAQEVLAALLLSKTHDRFYARTRGEFAHSQVEIDTLRGMIARTAAQSILNEIEDGMK